MLVSVVNKLAEACPMFVRGSKKTNNLSTTPERVAFDALRPFLCLVGKGIIDFWLLRSVIRTVVVVIVVVVIARS
jgi:hypothetical protein